VVPIVYSGIDSQGLEWDQSNLGGMIIEGV
jgi:hypothetical protein